MFIDSHCHLDRLDLTPFGGDLGRALQTAADNGVTHCLCVGIDLARWPAMLALVEPYPNVAVSVGVHPSETLREQASVEQLLHYAAHPRVVAIGETGLDYYYGKDSVTEQQASLRLHIAAARQARKPLIIHTRDARADTLAILRQEQAQQVGGVLHCFTEDWATAEAALELGFYISFSGIVTFRTAESLREVARRVPAERLLIETDAPYLAPTPHRGKSNHPAWVRHVAECLAKVREQSVEEIAAQTTANYHRLFAHGEAV